MVRPARRGIVRGRQAGNTIILGEGACGATSRRLSRAWTGSGGGPPCRSWASRSGTVPDEGHHRRFGDGALHQQHGVRRGPLAGPAPASGSIWGLLFDPSVSRLLDKLKKE